MNSLNDLNNYAQTSLTYTDVRAPKISFDRLTPTNQTATFSTGAPHQLPIGINITEIVNPGVEQAYLEINLTAVAGSSITAPTLPAGYSITNPSTGIFRILNIQSASDWDLIKNILINIPQNFKTNFTYTVTIGYEGNKTLSYTVAATYSTLVTMAAQVSATVSSTATGNVIRKPIITLACQVDLIANNVNIAILQANVSSSCTGKRLKGIQSIIAGTATLTASGQTFITNIVGRTFLANCAYDIFGTNTPQITDNTGGSDTYSLTFSCPAGEFGTTTSASSSYTLTGTKAAINSQISTIKFYSTKDTTSNTTYTTTLLRNSVQIFTRTSTLTYAGTASIVPTVYSFYNSTTWTPTILERKYCKLDYLVVAGGGAGGFGEFTYGATGGGGGGGGVKTGTLTSILNTVHTITVGLGGNPNTQAPFVPKYAPSGQISSVAASGLTTITAAAGQGGYGGGPATGGTSGNGFTGGASSQSGGNAMAGGGGGGAAQSGNPGTIVSQTANGGKGGNGVTSSISGTSVMYGAGGGGGVTIDGVTSWTINSGVSPSYTYGSGGHGGGYTVKGDLASPTAGFNGVVYFKTY